MMSGADVVCGVFFWMASDAGGGWACGLSLRMGGESSGFSSSSSFIDVCLSTNLLSKKVKKELYNYYNDCFYIIYVELIVQPLQYH